MNTSKKLTAERIEEIKNFPISFDNDIPEFTDEELKEFKPINQKYYNITPKKQCISIKIDIDVLEALKSKGKGYQTRINNILREAVISGHY